MAKVCDLRTVSILQFYSAVANKVKKVAKNKCDILVDQVINATIVGGIAGISSFAANPDATAAYVTAVIAFTMTFLYKMKEYRRIS